MPNKIEFFKTPYENYYASKNGEIFSTISKKCLSPKIDKDGYEEYTLTINGTVKYVRGHRIIAETFLSNPDNKPTVNHKNGIKKDNRVENLEWSTYSENNQHRFTVLHCYKPMKYIISYLYQGMLYTGFSLKDCEKSGISSTYLKNIINGTVNTYFMYFEKTENNGIKVFWNGKVYKEYSSAKAAAQDLGIKLNCLYVRAKRHKELEYITRDYEFFYEINNNNNNESVTTKETA